MLALPLPLPSLMPALPFPPSRILAVIAESDEPQFSQLRWLLRDGPSALVEWEGRAALLTRWSGVIVIERI